MSMSGSGLLSFLSDMVSFRSIYLSLSIYLPTYLLHNLPSCIYGDGAQTAEDSGGEYWLSELLLAIGSNALI